MWVPRRPDRQCLNREIVRLVAELLELIGRTNPNSMVISIAGIITAQAHRAFKRVQQPERRRHRRAATKGGSCSKEKFEAVKRKHYE
jgi:hypothetical protein